MWVQKNGNDIMLYGTIWNNDGQYIVSDLTKYLSVSGKVNIHVHSPGGSVFDGNLIFNAIKNAKADVTIIIDGLAASMMSIIMQAGKRVQMARNAFIMIHAPQGFAQGTAKDMEKTAKLLLSMEKEFKRVYGLRISDETKLNALMDGDNWFDAEEALAEGLVDEIIDPVVDDMPDMNAYKDFNFVASSGSFAQWEKPPVAQPEATQQSSNNSNQITDMELTAQTMTFLNLGAKATPEQIEAAVGSLAQKVKDLEAEKKARLTAQAKALVATALKDGKIVASEVEKYETRAENDYELIADLFAKLPKRNILKPETTGAQSPSADASRADWTFTKWAREDYKGLMAMKVEDPERYTALQNKK